MHNQNNMDNKSIMSDCLHSQRHLTEIYNNFAAESSDNDLRRQVMDIQRQEQDNVYKVFQVMSSKGWYQPEQADQQQINKLRSQTQNQGRQS